MKLRNDSSKNAESGLDLALTTNISVVNALWVILAGYRLDLDNERLRHIVMTIDKSYKHNCFYFKIWDLHVVMLRLLKDAKVSSLAAILFPRLFKLIHPRFQQAKDTFEGARKIMVEEIQKHMNSNNKDGDDGEEKEENGDFIDAYLAEIASTTDTQSSFYGVQIKK